MPSIEKATPVPGMYSEDLQGESGENKNPWAMLEDLAHDKPAYTVDTDGNYHYKQADAVNSFSDLVKEARKNGDDEKAEYYQSFMRNILKNDPISISGEDFDHLSDEGKLKYFRLGKMQAKINNDKEGLKQYSQAYESLVKQLQGNANTATARLAPEEEVPGSETFPNKTLSERVRFHFSDEKARQSLISVMKKANNISWSKVVYAAFSEMLPDDMEQEMPTGYVDFGVDFFKKQMQGYNGSLASLKELFDSDDYRNTTHPCILPQMKDVAVDEAMDFIHCFNPNKEGGYGGFGSEKDIECRFYLCPRPDNLIPIMNAFAQKNEKADLPYYFKFGLSPKRNDKLVIYSGGEVAEKQLAILESIQDEHPEWFEGSGENPLWGDIEGLKGVYYGAQPETNKESYGEKRTQLFHEAMLKWTKEGGIKWDKNQVKAEDLSDEQVKRFKKIFADVCRENNIEPKDFALVR